jgi:SET domain-containing protein
MTHITYSEQYGREVTSLKLIPKGTIVALCELLVLSEQDTKTVDSTDLKYYVFKYNETQDCLVMGEGEIFNHSDTPNTEYKLVQHEGRSKMQFTALDDIPAGTQLFTDYNADIKVNTNDYVQKNMVG